MRVDDTSRYESMLSAMQDSSTRQLLLQKQISTGQRIFKPSDDPVGYQSKDTLQTQLDQLGNQKQMLADQSLRLDRYDATLGDLVSNIRVARSSVQRASNAATDPSALPAIANQVDDLIKSSMLMLNQENAGSYIFGGTRTGAEPFVASGPPGTITAVNYVGDHNSPGIPLPDGQSLQVSIDGASVTQSGTKDLFATLINIRDQLKTGKVDASTALSDLAGLEDNLLAKRTQLGSASQYLTGVAATVSQREDDTLIQLQEVAGADPAATITQLMQEQTRQQATYSVIAKQNQMNLVDYLK